MDVLLRLQQWYSSQCDGDWEHQYGVCIDTLDNPGWSVKIDLIGTPFEAKDFEEIAEGLAAEGHPDEARWMHCHVRQKVWEGASDEMQLGRLLQVFLDWAGPDTERPQATGPSAGSLPSGEPSPPTG